MTGGAGDAMTGEGIDVPVLIIDDHEMVATALRGALDRRRGVRVVGVATTVYEGVRLARRTEPRVVLLDLHLREGAGTDAIGGVLEASPSGDVIVLTGWPSEQALLAALDAGATGFLTKTQPVDELLDAVVRVADGETVVCSELLPALVRRSRSVDRDHHGILTERELQVLSLLAQGEGTRRIADQLVLSPNTIRNHVARLMAKLDVHSRLEAVSEGVNRGLIDPRGRPR